MHVDYRVICHDHDDGKRGPDGKAAELVACRLRNSRNRWRRASVASLCPLRWPAVSPGRRPSGDGSSCWNTRQARAYPPQSAIWRRVSARASRVSLLTGGRTLLESAVDSGDGEDAPPRGLLVARPMAMGTITQEVLRHLMPLVGRKLVIARRAADLRGFHFGQVTPNGSGRGDHGEIVLHIQCAWRLEGPNGIVTGRSDLWHPAESSEGVDLDTWDYERGNLQDRRIGELLGRDVPENGAVRGGW
jgi:hypothetical protein